MQTIRQINILDYVAENGEQACQQLLQHFSCPINSDIADFLHNKAIPFAIQRISITYLIFQNIPRGTILSGFYTLTNKSVIIPDNSLSKTLQKRISKFTQFISASNQHILPMPLIAQLGKNYSPIAKEYPITGQDILNMANQTIQKIQYMIGGKTTYIECVPNPKLLNFYSQNGFIPFNERHMNENSPSDESTLIQMLKYS